MKSQLQSTIFKRLMAMLLVLALTTALVPLQARAAGDNPAPDDAKYHVEKIAAKTSTITSGAALSAEIAEQTVPYGTILEDLTLPDTIDVTVLDGEDEIETTASGVTWQSDPEYTSYTDTYEFTPILPESYALGDGVSLPVIAVTVEPMGIMPFGIIAEGTAITSFADLKDTIENFNSSASSDLTITIGADFDITSILTISNASHTLTIKSETGQSHTLTRGASVTGNLFTVSSGAQLTLESIIIDGNKGVVPDAGGQLIYAASSTLTINNGTTLQNNNSGVTSANNKGGAVRLSNANFTMNGGLITGNTGSNGGGIYMDCNSRTATMNGGKIIGNSATSWGGGVDIVRGKFVLNDGDIGESDNPNTAQIGGGVGVEGGTFFEMNGGSISYNQATGDGGGICSYGEVTIKGGMIGNNQAKNGGGINAGGVSAIGGSTQITNNTCASNGNGGGVYVEGSLTLGGTVVISGNTKSGGANNVYLTRNKTITLGTAGDVGSPAENMNIGIDMQVNGVFVDSGATESIKSYFFADSSTKTVLLDNGTLKLESLLRTVTYNLDGGTQQAGASWGSYIEGIGLTLPTAPTKAGHTFAGWYANADLSTGGVVTAISTADIGNKEFWAKWTAEAATYTITFNANGGTVAPASAQTGTDGKLISLPTPTRSGYTFDGWFTAENDGSKVTTSTMFTTNTIIYAHWIATGSGGGGNGGGGGYNPPTPDPTPNPTPAPTAPSPSVIVDGKETSAGTTEIKGDTTTVTVNQDMLNKEIETAKDNVTVIVPQSTGTAEAQFVVKNVEDMAVKDMTLTVQVGDVQYNLPSTAVDTAAVMAQFGVTDSTLVPISISVTTVIDNATQAVVDSAIQANGNVLVIPPIEFKVTASYDGKTVEIDTFSQYVSRAVEITAEQAQQITTALVIATDGTSRHVPTNVYQKDGKWYADVNSLTNSTYALIYNELTFTDARGKWYETAVNEMGSRMVISGIGGDLFAGERDITRAEFAAIIIRALGLPSDGKGTVFGDVPVSAWYAGAVGKAYEYGVVSGVGNNLFAPDKKITRQEAMLMIQRAAEIMKFTGTTGNLAVFTDTDSISAWALEAAKWNVGSGLIVGSNGLIRGTDNITRAETATLVLKLLQKAGLVDMRTPLTAELPQSKDVVMVLEPRKDPEQFALPSDYEYPSEE